MKVSKCIIRRKKASGANSTHGKALNTITRFHSKHKLTVTLMFRDLEKQSSSVASALLEARSHAQLVDFDAHLDDASKHWSNAFLDDLIASAT